jgi:hypothetical protein
MAAAEVERAYVVETDDVVVVLVREQDGIKVFGAGAEHLLTQVGPGIDQDIGRAHTQQG